MGRGIWQANLNPVPGIQVAIPSADASQTVFLNQTATYNGTASFLGGYSNSITLNCTPSANCSPLTPVLNLDPETDASPFSISATGPVGDYNFAIQGTGIPSTITAQTAIALHVVTFGITPTTPPTIADPRGTTSLPVGFQITAGGSFNQSVTVSCTVAGITGAICNLTPAVVVNPTATSPVNMTASVFVPAGTTPDIYTATVQATTSGPPAAVSTTFLVYVMTDPDFILTQASPFPLVNAGSTGQSTSMNITAQDGFASAVSFSCSLSPSSVSGSCAVNPASVNSFPSTSTVTLNAPTLAAGSYQMLVQGTSGARAHTLTIPFNVGDYQILGPQTASVAPGERATDNLKLVASAFYGGTVKATCDASSLSAAICTLSPPSPISVSVGATVPLTLSIDVLNNTAPGTYNITIATQVRAVRRATASQLRLR